MCTERDGNMHTETSKLLNDSTIQYRPQVLIKPLPVELQEQKQLRVEKTPKRIPRQPLERIQQAQSRAVKEHHVKITTIPITTKKVRKKKVVDDDYQLEEKFARSIQINETLTNVVNTRVMTAYKHQIVRPPIIAFMRSPEGINFINDFGKINAIYDIEYLKQPVVVSKEQLSVDLYHFDKEYSTIIGVILYLEEQDPPLVYVISRYKIAFTPKPYNLFEEEEVTDPLTITTVKTTTTVSTTTTTTISSVSNTKPLDITDTLNPPPISFIERFVHNCIRTRQTGYYYLIYVDLSLTKPK